VYEGVAFERVLLRGRTLTAARFVDCTWTRSDLSGAAFAKCVFQGCRFEDCKAVGVDWTLVARLAACEFERCVLDHVSFPGMKLAGFVFRDCRLREALLTGADLAGATLEGSDLTGATFGRTILAGADLRRANGFVLHPGENDVRGLRVSAEGVRGLLVPFGIEVV
jgi:fluoroquinolone resistance protein